MIASAFLKAPLKTPDGREEDESDLDVAAFSKAIEAALLDIFTATPILKTAWQNAKPIALGSWARHELCPKSDLDLLFVGEEAAAAEITRMAQEAGIKIRSRIPESRADWTVGVEAFDVLSLFYARPLTALAQTAYDDQLSKLRGKLKTLRRGYFTAIKK